MDTAAEALLIIVSATLAIFLIILSIVGILFMRVLKQISRITRKAESVADSVESAASAFEHTVSPLAVFKLISGIVKQAGKMKNKKE